MSRRNTAEKFWSKVDVKGPDDCWLWKGPLHPCGDAQWYWKGRLTLVHHVAFEIETGYDMQTRKRVAGAGAIVLRHTCDNPPCCNPRHLLLGTQLDNIRDKVQRNRCLKWTKLPDRVVVAIREKFSAGGITRKELADEFQICPSWIGRIVSNKVRVIDNL